MNIKALKQAKADNDVKLAGLKQEVNALLNVEFAARTDDQKARIAAADKELTAGLVEAKRIADEIALAERAADDERGSGNPPKVEVGKDLAAYR